MPGGASIAPGSAEVTFQPHTLPTATTWVEVEPGPIVRFEFDDVQGMPSMLGPFGPSWPSLFTVAELEALPTDAAGMLDALEAAVVEHETTGPRLLVDPTPDTEAGRRLARETSMVLLASELLASAPTSPEVRRAAFDALASLRRDGQEARVVRDASLPDGSPAIGVWSSRTLYPDGFVQPEGTSTPDGDSDRTRLLLDPQTGQLRVVDVRIGRDTYTTTWDEAERVEAGGDER